LSLEDEIYQIRKDKLKKIEALGQLAYPYKYASTHTVPEILDIRGVQSATSIKTLLDKRLIVARGRKEAVGRPNAFGIPVADKFRIAPAGGADQDIGGHR